MKRSISLDRLQGLEKIVDIGNEEIESSDTLEEKLDKFLDNRVLDKVSEKGINDLTNKFMSVNKGMIDQVDIMDAKELSSYIQTNISKIESN